MNYVNRKSGDVVVAVRFVDSSESTCDLAEIIFHDMNFSVDYGVSPPILKQYADDNPHVHCDIIMPEGMKRSEYVILAAKVGDWVVRMNGGFVEVLDEEAFVAKYREIDTSKDVRGVAFTMSLPLLSELLCREMGLPEGSLEVHEIHTQGWNRAAEITVRGILPEFPVVHEGCMFPRAYPIVTEQPIAEGSQIKSRVTRWEVIK